jgi:hypothetical protein
MRRDFCWKKANSNNNFDYIIFDHGPGEIADYISIREDDLSVEVVLYHAKAMKGRTLNGDLTDIYEVTQQANKSTMWLRSRSGLLDKFRGRKRRGHCILKKGEFTDLEKTFEKNKLLKAKVVIVQPAISKNSDMPQKYQEILAATNFYLTKGGPIKKFEIWGSK